MMHDCRITNALKTTWRHENIRESGGVAPPILDLGTMVVSGRIRASAVLPARKELSGLYGRELNRYYPAMKPGVWSVRCAGSCVVEHNETENMS